MSEQQTSGFYIVTLTTTTMRLVHAADKPSAIKRARAEMGLLVNSPVLEEGGAADLRGPFTGTSIQDYLESNELTVVPKNLEDQTDD